VNIQPSLQQNPLRKVFQDFEAAWKNQDYRRSIRILERASQKFSNDPTLFLDLGRAHGMRYDYVEAERCFDRAIRISGNKAAAFVAAGLHCVTIGRLEIAERYFERTLQCNGDSIEALVQLAELRERQNRLDTAAELVNRALRLDGNYASALLMQATLERHAGRLDEAERLLRSFAGKPNPDIWTQARAWYELGGILDRQGRFDEAMSSFLAAKVLMQPKTLKRAAEYQKSQQRVGRNLESTSAEHLRRWFGLAGSMEPVGRLGVLCGHPRSGTTLLEQVLDSHPESVSAEETRILETEAYLPLTRDLPPETHSLAEILDAATPESLKESRLRYFRAIEAFLGEPVRDRLLIDKNPSLTTLIPAIVRVFPEVKLLVAIRDPRDVCLSCFMQRLLPYGASVAYATLESTVSEYATVMDFWRTISTRIQNPFLEVRYEDIVNDLESTARRVIDFLGLPWDARVLKFDEHARQKIVRSPTYADVKKPVFKTAVGRWRNYQKYIEPHLERLEPFIKAFGYE
jgi:tetratricopeptide (TPR) repeat protein